MTGETYFIDIDGTIVPNLSFLDLENLYSTDTIQDLLPGVSHFFTTLQLLKPKDLVIFTTARTEKYADFTKKTLSFHQIKYHSIIFGLPQGRRFLINDTPNMFFQKSIAVNVLRDTGFGDTFIFDQEF